MQVGVETSARVNGAVKNTLSSDVSGSVYVSARGVCGCRNVRFRNQVYSMVMHSLHPKYVVSQFRVFISTCTTIFNYSFPFFPVYNLMHVDFFPPSNYVVGLGEIHTLFSTRVARDRSEAKIASGLYHT